MSAARARTSAAASLLVADIGGTNARFGVWYRDALHAEQVLKCSNLFNLLDARGAIRQQIAQAVMRIRLLGIGLHRGAKSLNGAGGVFHLIQSLAG